MKKNLNALKVFETIFGPDFVIGKVPLPNFPFIYENSFDIYSASGAFSFIFIVPKESYIPTDLINGVYQKCQNDLNKRVVVYLDNPSITKKEFFETHYMNFISSDGDIRLFEGKAIVPSFIIDDNEPTESYTKITQLIVNFYLTNKIAEYSVREIANSFAFSISSVSRANTFLHEINALEKNGMGNKAKYKLRSKKDFFERVKPFFINPIKNRKMLFISRSDIDKLDGVISGESALSHYTNLEMPEDFLEIALDKTKFESCIHVSRGSSETAIVCYAEELIYNAEYFAKGRIISPLDAYIIAYKRYSGNDDPRIKESLRKLERMIING